MKSQVCVLAVMAVCLSQAESLKSDIQAYNRAVSKAMMNKQFGKIEKMFKGGTTADFRYVEGGRKLTVDQMFEEIKAGLSSFPTVTMASATVVRCKEHAKTGEATCLYTMGGKMIGPDKKTHTVMSSGTSAETYVKVGGTWKMKSMVWSNNKMTMDGKPMDPSQMGHG
jgi:hypothetical protein